MTAIGACAAAPAVASQAVLADNHGYGVGGYGAGAYGDSETSEGDEVEYRVAVETSDPIDVDDESATLVGEVTELSGYDDVTVFFDWCEGDHEVPQSTPDQVLGTAGPFEDSITGLDAETPYEFRAVAVTPDGRETGGIRAFTTEASEQSGDSDGGGADDGEDEPDEHDDPNEDDSGEEENQNDDSDGDDDHLNVPAVQILRAEDLSNPRNPHVDALIEWSAAVDDGFLGVAELTLSDYDQVLEAWEYDLSGQSAERVEETRIRHGAGRGIGEVSYSVELTVTSNDGTSTYQDTMFDSR